MNEKISNLLQSAKVTDHGLQLFVVTFTPELASALLANSKIVNRDITGAALARISRQMPSWVLNGEPVILSKSLDIFDGHHRLTVCRNDKTNFTSVVIILPSDDEAAFDSINTGDPRKIKSLIEMKNPNLASGSTLHQSVLGWLNYYCFGRTSMSNRGNLSDQYKWATNDAMLSGVITDFQFKTKGSKELRKQLHTIGISASIYNSIRYLGLIAHPELTDEFLAGLLTGSGIVAEDLYTGTIFLARNILLVDKDRTRHYHASFKFELLHTMLAWRIEQREVGTKLGRFKPLPIPGAEPKIVKERLGFPVDADPQEAAA